MWGRSSLSSMLVLLSRLEMYSSFNFTTYTDTMHQSCPKWLLARVPMPGMLVCAYIRALGSLRKGFAALNCSMHTFSSTLFLLSKRAFS